MTHRGPSARTLHPAGRQSRGAGDVGAVCKPARMGSSAPNEWPVRPRVLLWDIDNMPGKHWQFLSLARVLSLTVPEGAPRYAAARRGTWRRTQPMLAQYGFEVLSGGRSTSGADRRLCDTGRSLRRHGYRRFVVVSNDHFFSRLASFGEIDVVTLDPANLGTRLSEAARSVTVLTFNGATWVSTSLREAEPHIT